jgi:hypothetical protein
MGRYTKMPVGITRTVSARRDALPLMALRVTVYQV